MIKELWNSFPKLLVQKINALLDHAEPNPSKAFQLYKSCQRENLWQDSFERFSYKINQFFSLPKTERNKSRLDCFLDRPMDMVLYQDFQLYFGNCVVDGKTLQDLISWTHNLIRVGYKTDSILISIDILSKTFHLIVNPPIFEKVQRIQFTDFCAAWKKIVFQFFGSKYDSEFSLLLNEVNRLDQQLAIEQESRTDDNPFIPTIYLTQTEIDWTIAVKKAVEQNAVIPKYPLSKGPQKQRLVDLSRTISLYKIVQTTRLPEFMNHRDSIRTTILNQCDRLLQETAK